MTRQHYDDQPVNGQLRSIMIFVDRVGFPILAFLLMFGMSYFSLDKMTAALRENTAALTIFAAESKNFQALVTAQHDRMDNKLEAVYEKTYGYLRGIEIQDNFAGKRPPGNLQ